MDLKNTLGKKSDQPGDFCLHRYQQHHWWSKETKMEMAGPCSVDEYIKAPTYSTALKWISSGKRKQGRPLGTWRRTIETEMKQGRHGTKSTGVPKTGLTADILLMSYAPVGAKRTRADYGRHSGLMFSTLDSGSRGLGLSPKAFYTHRQLPLSTQEY